MSQVQSEVRPTIVRMPMSGYVLQTGGSARKRTIKPQQTQAATDQYPIQNEFRVSGVPGHTHNSSAVASVLVDLDRTRGFAASITTDWAEEKVDLLAADPGDSDLIDDETERFSRALERGIGEICLRPENCHHEIREPARSISEIRTLVAPDDRLQTLTYVEEVGGFINQDGGTYISDYPDVHIDIMGYNDPDDAKYDGANSEDQTKQPVFLEQQNGGYDIVVLRDNDKAASIGTFPDGTDWFGIVKFRWDPSEMLYKSDSFQVTLKRVVEFKRLTAGPDPQAARALRVRFPVMKTTRAGNGYCFFMKPGLNNIQALRSAIVANANVGARATYALQFRPSVPVEVLDTTKTVTAYNFRPQCAYRIKIGGNYAIPGLNVDGSNYFQIVREMAPKKIVDKYASHFLAEHAAGDWAGGGVNFGAPGVKYGNYFGGFAFSSPVVLPQNSQKGANFEGYTVAPQPATRCMPVQPLDVTDATNASQDYTTSTQAIGHLWAGAGNVTDAQHWILFTANQVNFSETVVSRQLIPENIMPTKFAGQDPGDVDDADSFFHWLKNTMVGIDKAANDGAAAEDKIPSVSEWLALNPGMRNKKTMTTYGTSVKEIDSDQKMMMVPAVLKYYADGDTLGFAYHGVNHPVSGEEDFHLSLAATTVKVPLTSPRFYIVSDASTSTEGAVKRAEISCKIRDLYEIPQTSHTVAGNRKDVFVTDVLLAEDKRNAAANQAANATHFKDGFAVGSIIECVNDAHTDATAHDIPRHVDHRLPVLYDVRGEGGAGGPLVLRIQNLMFSFDENRTFFIGTNEIGTEAAAVPFFANTCHYFHTRDCEIEFVETGNANEVCVVTVVKTIRNNQGAIANYNAGFMNYKNPLAVNQRDQIALCHLGKPFQDAWFGDPPEGTEAVTLFDAIRAESSVVGPVYQSKKRISQHLCAPILNPNSRIGCTAPLNFETGHLPPELRDFRLELRDVDFSFLPGKVQLEPLVLYEFDGGNQVVAAEDNLLHLPQFRESYAYVQEDGTFDFEMFSPYGMPSYIAIFCRDEDRSRDHMTQPLIKQLSIMCNTTKRKSNAILEANVHQLYHITQRNVNQRARYNRETFNKRQVILLSAEDVGMMGLETESEFQNEKRAQFRFHGTVDQKGRITAVLVFNNRGLYIKGKHMSVVRLKD